MGASHSCVLDMYAVGISLEFSRFLWDDVVSNLFWCFLARSNVFPWFPLDF